jgi:LPS-assembly protein
MNHQKNFWLHQRANQYLGSMNAYSNSKILWIGFSFFSWICLCSSVQLLAKHHQQSDISDAHDMYPPQKFVSNSSVDPNICEILAKEIIFDEKKQCIIAKGHITIFEPASFQKKQPQSPNRCKLKCDEIQYDLVKDTIIAHGNVELYHKNGTLTYAKSIELSEDFKKSFAQSIKLLMKDQSCLWAKDAKRDEEKIVLNEGAFTPCILHKKGKQTWELQSKKIEHLSDEKILKFYDVKLRIKNIPVFYFPYLAIPDPSVKRRTGLLAPMVGRSSDLGFYYVQPYFIAPNQFEDFTLSPMVTSDQFPAMLGQYRRCFVRGKMALDASGTITKKNKKINPNIHKKRWHFSSQGNFNLNSQTRTIWDITRASDINYFATYNVYTKSSNFLRPKNLGASLGIEHYLPRGMLIGKAHSFQTEDPNHTPIVLPHVSFENFIDMKEAGTAYLEVDILNLYRRSPTASENGMRARTYSRLALQGSYLKSFMTQEGSLWEITLGLRGDGIWTRQQRPEDRLVLGQNAKVHSKTYLNTIPTGKLQWSFPMHKIVSSYRWIIEPSVSAISQTALGRKNEINEDSQIIALDETNLFSINRLGGWDQYDVGNRLVVGVQQWIYQKDARRYGVFLGQSYRLDQKRVFPYGDEKKASDYIVRALIQPYTTLKFHWRSAIDSKTKKIRISEIGTSIGQRKIINISHIYTPTMLEGKKKHTSQLQICFSLPLSNQWSTYAAQIFNLHRVENRKKNLATFVGVQYRDEDGCFQVKVGAYRNNYHGVFLRSDTGIQIEFSLKHLGDFKPISGTQYQTSSLTNFNM